MARKGHEGGSEHALEESDQCEKTVLFHVYILLFGHEDTCTPWTLYSCSALGSKPEDRVMAGPELPSLTSPALLPHRSPFCPFPGSSRGCGL